MAAIDFPASPTDGQLFAAGNGVTYQWSAAKGLWLLMGGQGPVIISATAPSNPVPGALWWCNDASSGGGQLYVYYQDPNTSQWVAVAAPAATAVPTAYGFSRRFGSGSTGTAGDGAWHDLGIWDTVDFDTTGGTWSPSGAQIFTVPANRAGMWKFDIGMYFSNSAATWNYLQLGLVVNGAVVRAGITSAYSGVLYATLVLPVLVRLNVGDQVKTQYLSNATTITIGGTISPNGSFSSWTGTWMGR